MADSDASSFWDDITPDFGNSAQMGVFGALGNILAAGSAPRYTPTGLGVTGGGWANALASLTGSGIQGMTHGAEAAQQYQAQNLANQNAAVMNPIQQQAGQIANQSSQMMLDYNKQRLAQTPFGSGQASSGGAGSLSDMSPSQLMQLGHTLLYSPSDKDRETGAKMISTAQEVLKSGLTTDQSGNVAPLPGYQNTAQSNAYATELGKTQGGTVSTPQGTLPATSMMGNPASNPAAGPAFGSLSPAAMTSSGINNIIANRTPSALGPGAQMAPPQPQAPTPSSLAGTPTPDPGILINDPQAGPTLQNAAKVTASDGKPYVPSMAFGAAKPDPSGTPSYKTPNTTTGVEQTKTFIKQDVDDDKGITDGVANTNQMLGRLHDISAAYNQSAPGTAVSLNPDLMSKLISVGAITDKGVIKDTANYQRVLADQSLEVLNQLKTTIAGSGQLNRTEVQNSLGKIGDPHLQPGAVKDIMAVSTGVANYQKDMADGWDSVGGLGNRQAGGYTLRPADYEKQFAKTHNLDDYIQNAKQTMPQVMGASLPKFTSPSDPGFASLPSGAKFVDETGKQRVKH